MCHTHVELNYRSESSYTNNNNFQHINTCVFCDNHEKEMPVADVLFRAPVDDQANDEVAIIKVNLPACDPDRLDRILGKACLYTIQGRISNDKICSGCGG